MAASVNADRVVRMIAACRVIGRIVASERLLSTEGMGRRG